MVDISSPDIEYFDLASDKEEILFSSKHNYCFELNISPFRPEMFGSLIYVVIAYLCDKYNVKLVMHGEANMLPFYSLYSDKCVIYNLNKFYLFNGSKFDINREIWSEHIQRHVNNIIDQDKVRFCTRYSITPHTHKGSILGYLLDKISEYQGIDKNKILNELHYSVIKNYFIDRVSRRKLFLHKRTKQCLDAINIKKNQIWFCSHNKPLFKTFEEYIYQEIPDQIIADSLWRNKQQIQKKIFDIDANCLLSSQIVSSIEYGTRFIGSGGVCTLFQTIPFILTLHLSIWDYYVLEMEPLKSFFLQSQNKYHKLFHIGGVLPYSIPIPFGGKYLKANPIKIPKGAPVLNKYDDNIVHYNHPLSEYLVKRKQEELAFIKEAVS